MNKPKNSGGYRFVSRQRKRTLRKRGEDVYFDLATGFFIYDPHGKRPVDMDKAGRKG